MNWSKEWKPLALISTIFLIFYFFPIESIKMSNPFIEAVALAKWYAREHVILCLVPAFFIAGAISVFVSQNSVIKYLGAKANKALSYGVASISGSILAVCSCTVLPLFAGIYRMGAGIGPATAFLYAGPAVNVLAIILTARILGLELGIARAIGAILFSIIIGLSMQFIFRNDKITDKAIAETEESGQRPLWQNGIYFALMVGILVFANWSGATADSGIWEKIYRYKWIVTGLMAAGLGIVLVIWMKIKIIKILLTAIPVILAGVIFSDYPLIAFSIGAIGLSFITATTKGEPESWFSSSWDLAKQIFPLLFLGIIAAGLLLGRPGGEGFIPSTWIGSLLGGNSIVANLFASVAGAFMYFATLTEVPILQGLIGNGMGKGPALALLLAGPALSLPNMLVIRSIMGTKKTVVFVVLVMGMAAVSGYIYGAFF
ncbi:MAG: permease [Candidatus Zixiibacteriota bacterium]